MGLVVLDGVVVLLLVLFGLREAMLNAIPEDLRRAIGAGIGLFIAFIGAVNAHIVVRAPAGPPVTYGSLHAQDTAIALVGLLVTAFLLARKVKGAILLGILFGTGVALAFGATSLPKGLAAPSFEVAFRPDVLGALKLSFVPLLLSLLLVDFFDTLGTVTAISDEGGLRRDGRIPRLRAILVVDSLAASIGGLFGASSVTSYIESAAGVGSGARTGLHSVVVGLLFLACIFLAPYATMVPACATAPALILVGFLMASQIARIDFEKLDTAIPAFVTLVTIPFTYSIAHGIGYGFITYVAIKALSLRFRDIHPLMACAAAAFAAYFIWGKV
jgi:AGZA family xanthine/uracil permease-like MFS transporter